VSLCDHNSDNADQKCNGEEHRPGWESRSR
jgi:hypothetical protein